jgi:hypothetical protein
MGEGRAVGSCLRWFSSSQNQVLLLSPLHRTSSCRLLQVRAGGAHSAERALTHHTLPLLPHPSALHTLTHALPLSPPCCRYAQGVLIEVNAHSLFSKWFSESGKLVARLFAKIQVGRCLRGREGVWRDVRRCGFAGSAARRLLVQLLQQPAPSCGLTSLLPFPVCPLNRRWWTRPTRWCLC